jgi:hypothetical protein
LLASLFCAGCSAQVVEIGKLDLGKTADLSPARDQASADQAVLFDARSPRPTIRWAKTFGGRRSDIASGVDVHRESGNIFVTGSFNSGADLGTGRLTCQDQASFLTSPAAAKSR